MFKKAQAIIIYQSRGSSWCLGPCPTGDQRSMCDENYDLLISIPMIGAGASWSRNGLSQVAAAECVRHEKPSGSTAGGIEPGKNMLESSL